MPYTHLADAADLNLWAAHRHAAAALLPKLVRRLILQTTDSAERVEFRAGEGVYLPGWDGVVLAAAATAFVPQGASVWEMGVGDPGGKANEDYSKRTADPRGVTLADTTFVFVTPRRWPGKSAWLSDRTADGLWRSVRAFDADDLETWLEHAPSVHLWVSALVGKPSDGVQSLDDWWSGWSAVTNPQTPAALLLAGREDQAQRIQAWRDGDGFSLTIRADAPDEGVAFLAAHAQAISDDTNRERIFASTLVVTSEAVWTRLCKTATPLVLVQLFQSTSAVGQARRGHRVVVPSGRVSKTAGTAIDLPRISRGPAEEALRKAGLTEHQATPLAGIARRSLTAFRRNLSDGAATPVWASPSDARTLLPALLLGRWRDAVPGDVAAVERLARVSYVDAIAPLRRWSLEPDPPIRQVAGTWYLTAPEDAWSWLAPSLLAADLDAFTELAGDVLAAVDPKFDLADHEQWLARTRGLVAVHSEQLRIGIAQTLALMATRADEAHAGLGLPTRAAMVVRSVLDRAHADWRVWATLGRALSVLVEAAPDEFLGAVGRGLAGEPPPLRAIFRDAASSLFGESPHPSVIWALETLAWSTGHLSAATLALAGLARIDPGGKLANRPGHSLRTIFLLWMPQTSASMERRLEAIDLLRQREPTVAWKLMCDIMPTGHDTSSHTTRPTWRDWAPDGEMAVLHAEMLKGWRAILDRLLQDVGVDGVRWAVLVDKLQSLPQEWRADVVSPLAALSNVPSTVLEPRNLQRAIRQLVGFHRSHSHADWTLPPALLESLAAVHQRLDPVDPVERYMWLFAAGARLLDGSESDDWRKEQEEIQAARQAAIREVFSAGGHAGVVALAQAASIPELVGFSSGRVGVLTDVEDRILSEGLAASDPGTSSFAFGLLKGRASVGGQHWLAGQLAGASANWTPDARACVLMLVTPGPTAWAAADAFGRDTARAYWKRIPYFHVGELTNAAAAASLFVEHGRPFSAVDLVAAALYQNVSLEPSTVLGVLTAALTPAPVEEPQSDGFADHVLKLMESVQVAPELEDDAVARVEWLGIRFFRHSHRGHRPVRLHRAMSRDPDVFISALKLVFTGDDIQAADHDIGRNEAAAHNAYELLSSWRVLPGSQDDGSIDGAALLAWVRSARQLAAACGRTGIADDQIGAMLSGSPADPDGAWPHPSVAAVIDEISTEAMDSGFRCGIFNSRGVSSRRLFEGGVQERSLADTYRERAAALSSRWPRTASVLRALADTYARHATSEDEEAERDQDLGY